MLRIVSSPISRTIPIRSSPHAAAFNSELVNPELIKTTWRWFFLLAALEAGAAVVALGAHPLRRALRLHDWRCWPFSGLGVPWRAVSCSAPLARPAKSCPPAMSPAAAGIFALVIGLELFLLRYLDPERLLPILCAAQPPAIFSAVVFRASLQFSLLMPGGTRLSSGSIGLVPAGSLPLADSFC